MNIGDEVNRNHDVCLPVFTVNVTFNRITLIVENKDDGLQPAPNHGRQLLNRQLTMRRMSAATLLAVKWNLQTAVAHEQHDSSCAEISSRQSCTEATTWSNNKAMFPLKRKIE